jgi:hypothetical protein
MGRENSQQAGPPAWGEAGGGGRREPGAGQAASAEVEPAGERGGSGGGSRERGGNGRIKQTLT